MDTYDINPETRICIYMHIFSMCVYIETGYSICRAVIFCRFNIESEPLLCFGLLPLQRLGSCSLQGIPLDPTNTATTNKHTHTHSKG